LLWTACGRAWRRTMNIAIYDLDKTITRTPTFTRFLIYFARRRRPFRLAWLALWVFALIGYRIGLYGRKPLKQFGIALFMGRKIPKAILQKEASDFVTEVVMNDLTPGVIASIEADRKRGCHLLIATAAPEFYAKEIGDRLGFDGVIATRHIGFDDKDISNRIDGENCYGKAKLAMIEASLAACGWQRGDVKIRFYSDHPSDSPVFDWADEPRLVGVGDNKRLRALAKDKHWQIVDFNDRQR
jgi:phosphatidylglycerophosphatase C